MKLEVYDKVDTVEIFNGRRVDDNSNLIARLTKYEALELAHALLECAMLIDEE